MADVFHHSVSSSRKWGGEPEDYMRVHAWFDATKRAFSDPRHRALRHHAEGIGWCIDTFGTAIEISICAKCGEPESTVMHDFDYQPEVEEGAVHQFEAKKVPTRWIAEQHVLEDFGRIPTVSDFLRLMTVEPWMVRGARKLSRELA